MVLPVNTLPFGLRDVKLTPIDDAGTLGTAVDLPASLTFSFSEAEEFETARGDDGTVAIRGKGPLVNWSLESTGISLAAWKVLVGGTVTSSGTTPALKKALLKKGTDVRPYFLVEGQMISDSGGDVHGTVYKCRATGDLSADFNDGEFAHTSIDGQGIPNDDGDLYLIEQNETAVAIS